MSLLRTLDEQGLRPWLKSRQMRTVRGHGIQLHSCKYTGLPHLVALIGKRVEVVYEQRGCKFIEIYFDDRWIGTATDIRFITEQQRIRMYAADASLRQLDQADREAWLQRAAGRAWAGEGQLPVPEGESPRLLETLDELQLQSGAGAEALASMVSREPAAKRGVAAGNGAEHGDFARPREHLR